MQRYGAARTVCQDTPNTWPHPNPSSSRTMLHSIRPCSALSPNPSAAQPTLRSQTVAPPNPTLRRRHGAYPEGAAPGREAGTVADGLAIRRVLVGHAFPPLALGLLRQLLKQPSAVPAADPAGPPLRLWRRGRKAWIWSLSRRRTIRSLPPASQSSRRRGTQSTACTIPTTVAGDELARRIPSSSRGDSSSHVAVSSSDEDQVIRSILWWSLTTKKSDARRCRQKNVKALREGIGASEH